MSRKGLTVISRVLRTLFLTLLFAFASNFITPDLLQAADLPTVGGSNLAGFAFNDRPMLLPNERNFQMAMITASADVGRSCGKIEAFGWRMNTNEQFRVNKIFNDTVNGLRDLGYKVEAQSPSSVSRDVTLITADRPDKHFLLMWSAGDIGLVMVICENSGVLHNKNATAYDLPAPQFSPQYQEAVITSALDNPALGKPPEPLVTEFSPAGDWIGSYVCHQGYTGGTLHISHVDGRNFDGVFRFYPTPKNPLVPAGSYQVYGQYDAPSKRILINPGQWIERPRNFYNTVIVGSFDTDKRTFSGYFQGVTGCTSFEANYAGSDLNVSGEAPVKPVKKVVKHKKKTRTVKEAPLSIVPDQAPGLMQPPSAPAITPQTIKKSSANSPKYGKEIVLAASGQWFTPTVPQAPQATVFTPQVPQAPQASTYNTTAPQVPQAPQAPQPQYYNPIVPQVPQAQQVFQPSYYNTTVPEVPQAPQVPPASVITPTVPQAPPAQYITIGAGAR